MKTLRFAAAAAHAGCRRRLRQGIEGGPPLRPEKYLDLSYYDRALKLVK